MARLDSDRRLLQDGVGGRWLDRDSVLVSGRDAVAFLQGQCSQDVAALAVGASAWTWLLQPRGKVEVLARVTRTAADAMVLDTDGGWGEVMVNRLARFKLRTKADITPLAWHCLALRGPGASAVAPAAGAAVAPEETTGPAEAAGAASPMAVAPEGTPEAVEQGADPGTALVLEASWPGLAGVDLLGPDPAVPAGVAIVSPEAWEWARVNAGIPLMGAELTEDTIPAETGLVSKTVSFTKGCYTGQELVARIDSRGGNVPRHLRRIVLAHPAPVGASVTVDGKAVGRLTSVAPDDDGGTVALAYLSRNVTPPVEVSVSWPGGLTEGWAESAPPTT